MSLRITDKKAQTQMLDICILLSESEKPMTVTEIANATGIPKPQMDIYIYHLQKKVIRGEGYEYTVRRHTEKVLVGKNNYAYAYVVKKERWLF